MTEHFGDVLQALIQQAGQTPGRLEELTQIPKQTIVSWVQGRVKRPRSWSDIVRLAAALRLYATETDRLLMAAGHPPLATLLAQAEATQDEAQLALFAHWRTLSNSVAPVEAPPHIPFQTPARLVTFVGRSRECAAVAAALQTGAQRCVLHGMGGVGKTALATEVAYQLRPHFPDGVLWANLENAVHNGRLQEPLLRALVGNLIHAYGRTLDDDGDLHSRSSVLREVLANKRALLVLDNAHGADDLQYLLPASTGACAVLITTRNRSLLRTEAFRLELTPFADSDALALLMQAIGAERLAAEATGSAALIRLLGGLPLAVKIIAGALAESSTLTLAEYAEALEDERLLLAHLADWTDATLNVRASFELSYRLLPAPLRTLFGLLTLFHGGDFDPEAVAAVTALPAVEAKRQLARLHTLSLIESGRSDTQAHYRFHPLVRLFAQEKVQETPALTAALADGRRRAADYYLTLAHICATDYARLAQCYEHLLRALHWAQENQAWSLLRRGVNSLTAIHLGVVGFWDARGYWQEAQQWLTTLASVIDHGTPAAEQDVARAELCYKLGLFAFRLADLAAAEAHLQQSLHHLPATPERGPECGPKRGLLTPQAALIIAYCCELLAQLAQRRDPAPAPAWVARGIAQLQAVASPAAHQEIGYLQIRQATLLAQQGQLPEAQTILDAGLARLPSTPSAARVSALMTLGILQSLTGQTVAALTTWRAGIVDAEALGDGRRLAGLWQNIGAAESRRGHFQAAIANQEAALSAYRRIGDVAGECLLRSNLADDYLLLHQEEAAAAELTLALALARDHHLPDAELYTTVNLARLALQRRQPEPAQRYLAQATALCTTLADQSQATEIQRLTAELHHLSGDARQALALLEPLLTLVDSHEVGLIQRLMGVIQADLGHTAAADAAFQASAAAFAAVNAFEGARTHLAWGRVLQTRGDAGQARPLLQQALATFQTLALASYVQDTQALLAVGQ